MPRFVKRAVEVEARLVTAETMFEVAEWCGGHVTLHEAAQVEIFGADGLRRVARLGDYVVEGVAGDFYPVKADAFDASYDAAGG